MIVFEEEFAKSDGQPIIYKGRTVVGWDQMPLPDGELKIRYRILSTNSEWRQGISLATKGKIDFGGGQIITKGWGDIWEDLMDHEGEFICRSKNKLLDVKNVWDIGDGCVQSWYNGAAIWIEEIPGGRRYHCNDGHPDDDFDDIVFELTIVE